MKNGKHQEKVKILYESVGCIDCFKVQPQYITTENDLKRCKHCGGVVLNIQELLDKIADLQSNIREIEDYYNGKY